MRLIGSSATSQRRAVAREGLRVGAIGSALGTLLGIAATAALLGVGLATGFLPELPYALADPIILLPTLAVF